MSTRIHARPRTATRTLIAGGLLMATVDIVYACLFWWLMRDVPPERVLQFIASGAMGNDAFRGGAATAALGAAFHYGIAMAMVAAFYVASGRLRMLLAHPLLNGALYGVVLWMVMDQVVVPLSMAEPSTRPFPLADVTNFAMHVLLGVICAWTARRARGVR